MTTGTPAPAGLASYERPVGVNPPLDYPAYRSAALRAPRRFDIHLQGDQETVFFDE